jgi:hypothetical protein
VRDFAVQQPFAIERDGLALRERQPAHCAKQAGARLRRFE